MQIRLKARTTAAEKGIEDFKGGPSWCFRFLGRRGLSINNSPPDFEEILTNFCNFTQENIAENFIGSQDVINMEEVPLTFDLPLNRTINKNGESSVMLKTTGHEKTHFTCVLGCTASGEKIPPMVTFKRIMMPKENFSKDIVVKVNKKGWMVETLMKAWLTECYSKRLGGFFRRNKAMLILNSMRAHMSDSVKEAMSKKPSERPTQFQQ